MTVKRPVVPLPAATLALLRDGAGGPEVLLIQRHRDSKFAGGDFVFPGGKIDPSDRTAEACACCAGLDEARAAGVLEIEEPGSAAAYWVGAIREAFEEVGILLAYDTLGRPADLPAARWRVYRDAVHAGGDAFWEMLRDEKLTLATDRLVYFAHWVTPEERPYRYDTRFFAAPMPAGQEAVADDREIIAVRWLRPADALAAQASGEISLRLPTIRNLMLLDGDDSVATTLRRLTGRSVPVIRPRLIEEGGQPRALLPGDPGYF